MSIQKEIINTEIRTSGFKKVQEDIIKTMKTLDQYQDELKELKHQREELIAAEKKGTEEYRNVTKRITELKANIKLQTDELKKQESQLTLTQMSYKQLSQRASELRKKLQEMSEAVDPTAYAKARTELKLYESQMAKMRQGIKQVNKEFENTPSRWGNLNKILSAVGITAAAMQLKSLGEKAVQIYTSLDDKMADVQKTTGMTKDEVKALDAELMKIDTRTSREDLLDLARVAGKLGVAKEEVAGFVRATDQIRVALSEDLGDNIEESIQMVGKLTSIFHLREDMGLEQSLLAVGSAINSLGAASEANESYLVDFTNRTAGVAPQAQISIQNVLGLGATLDQLGQTAEVAGTTFTQVITGMFKRTEDYARVAGMSVSEFSRLLKEDANEAFIRFLEGANNGGDMEAMTKSLASLKLEGTRSTQVIGALAGNVDMLRQQQALANTEFAKATSLTDEYNTKNNSAQAEIDKRRKAIDQITASLGEKLMPLWTDILGLTASGLDILTALIGTLTEYKGLILTAIGVGTAYIAVQKLRNFYSKENRASIAAEALSMKAKTVATTTDTTATAANTAATKAATLGDKAWAAAKALLTLQFRAAATAAKAFFLSLGPIGWIVTAVSALIPLFSSVKSAINAASEASERLSQEQAKLNSELSVETSKINILFGRLRNATKGTEEYSKAKQAILSQYGSYLEGMSKEIKSLDDVKGAYEAITRAVRESVIERLRANQVEAAAQEAGQAWETALTNMDQNLQKAFKKGKEGLAKTLFPSIREALDAENTTVLSDIEAARYRVLQVLQTTYGKAGAASIYNRISADIEEYLKATDKFKARQNEINRIYGEGRLPTNAASSAPVLEGTDGGTSTPSTETKASTKNWSLTSDESYLRAKAELIEKQLNGEIATEAEYNRLVLALEIETLEKRIAAQQEKGTDLAKLEEQLLEKRYQQQKTARTREQQLLDIAAHGASDSEQENAAYEKQLKDLDLFGRQIEEMTETEQAAYLQLKRAHYEKLSSLYVDELAKEIDNQQKSIQRKATALKQAHADELVTATTFEQKKALIAQWASESELRRIKTDKQADQALQRHYAEEEQAALKEDLNRLLETYQSIVNEIGDTGLLANGIAATEEDAARLQAIIDNLKKQVAELGVTPQQTFGGEDRDTKRKDVDIFGMTRDQWAEMFDNLEESKDKAAAIGEAISAFGGAFSEAFGTVSNLMTAMEERDLKNFEKSQNKKKKLLERQLKSGTISQERYNEAVQLLDEQTDAKREEMERKQAKREKLQAVFNSLINTAVAVTAALPNIPLSIIVAAMGAAETAAILATPLPGAEDGGMIGVDREQDGKHFYAEFTPRKRGFIRRPTVIRTTNGQPILTAEAGTEYVVPNDLLRHPEVAEMVSLIEAARLSGSFRSPRSISTSVPGFETGGYVGENYLSPSVNGASRTDTASLPDNSLIRELRDAVGKLSKKLDEPIPVYNSIYGRDGIETIKKKLIAQQRRAGIGGK